MVPLDRLHVDVQVVGSKPWSGAAPAESSFSPQDWSWFPVNTVRQTQAGPGFDKYVENTS